MCITSDLLHLFEVDHRVWDLRKLVKLDETGTYVLMHDKQLELAEGVRKMLSTTQWRPTFNRFFEQFAATHFGADDLVNKCAQKRTPFGNPVAFPRTTTSADVRASLTEFIHTNSMFFTNHLLQLEQLLVICRALYYEHAEMPISVCALAACVAIARAILPQMQPEYANVRTILGELCGTTSPDAP